MAPRTNREGWATIVVYVPEDEHRQIRVYVAESGVTVNSLVTVLLRRLLAAPANEQAAIVTEAQALTDERRRRS